MLQPGSQIAGYRIERLLGQGGMGRVYEATQLSLDRPVALKILSDELRADEALRARFRREGRVQGAMTHPHIVAVLEAGEADGHLFIAMQVVRGPTLKELVNEGTLDPVRAVALLGQIATALDAAHAAGFTHRDMKPENVLIGPGDHAFLADFGLTKTLADSAALTRTGRLTGTTHYVSPEQIRGQPATPASDIYGLAAILYESLTGSVPFPRYTEAAVLFAHISSPPPAVTDRCPELPAALSTVVAQGLAKSPSDRPATATAMLESARAALALPSPGGDAAPAEAQTEHGERRQATSRLLRRRPVTDADFPPTMAPGSRLVPPESDPALAVPDHLPPELTEIADAEAASADPPATTGAPLHRRRAAGAVLGSVVVAAVAGVLTGGHGNAQAPAGTPPLSSTAADGRIALSFPATWHTPAKTPTGRVLGLSAPLTLGAARGASLAAGMTGASTPQLLMPAALKAVTGTLPAPQHVRVGALSAYRYTGVRLRGVNGVTEIVAGPASTGIVTLACTIAAGAPSSAASDCTRIFATVRLQRGHPTTLGADAGYAKALRRMLLGLNQARTPARRALARATGPKSQASAARTAATTYRTAAAALRRVTPGPVERAAHDRLGSALTASATAYGRLGSAARGGHRTRYAAASTAIRAAEHDVSAALATLGRLGYRVG
ncbi:MAG: protein kinase [Baekduia sp.]